MCPSHVPTRALIRPSASRAGVSVVSAAKSAPAQSASAAVTVVNMRMSSSPFVARSGAHGRSARPGPVLLRGVADDHAQDAAGQHDLPVVMAALLVGLHGDQVGEE